MSILALGISGCGILLQSTVDAGASPVRVLYQSTHCGQTGTQPSGKWINDPATYGRLYGRLRSGTVGAAERQPPPVNFAREGVLWINMGQKPTGGYTVDPVESGLEIRADTATLRVAWTTPPPDAVLAQVITRPCLLLALPKGGYSRIRVVDLSGRERLEIFIHEAASDP
jgi:hypothetical protein